MREYRDAPDVAPDAETRATDDDDDAAGPSSEDVETAAALSIEILVLVNFLLRQVASGGPVARLLNRWGWSSKLCIKVVEDFHRGNHAVAMAAGASKAHTYFEVFAGHVIAGVRRIFERVTGKTARRGRFESARKLLEMARRRTEGLRPRIELRSSFTLQV